MRLLRPSGVLFLAFVLAVAACAPAATPTAAPATPTGGPPIRIGAPFNLTGGMASIDVPAANGARLAAEEINAAGGVLGRPLELLIRDTKTAQPPRPRSSPS